MKIILGITGSVAAVLTPKLISALLDSGHEIKIIATSPALYFTKTQTLFDKRIIGGENGVHDWAEVFLDKDEWPEGGYHKNDTVRHINFRDWADVLLIAPLSANTLAKIAHGMADNFLCCTARAWKKEKPLILAPAMNTEMWIDPITNLQLTGLSARYQRLVIVDPISKILACGDEGLGAMAKIETIVEAVNHLDIQTK